MSDRMLKSNYCLSLFQQLLLMAHLFDTTVCVCVCCVSVMCVCGGEGGMCVNIRAGWHDP